MQVALIGTGPAAEAIEAALADGPDAIVESSIEELGASDLAVVIGRTGDSGFETANEIALETETPWIAVEVGGVGGRPIDAIDAGVSTFAPGRGCYVCLRSRVAANADDEKDGPEPTAEPSAVRLAGAIAGHTAVSMAAGVDRAGRTIEVPYVERRFLPVPTCPACESPVSSPDAFEHETVSIEDAISRGERAIDDRVGIVASIAEAESYPAAYYLAELADTTGLSDGSAPSHAAGVATDWNAAFMKAIGESLERYAGAIYRADRFAVDRPDAVDGVPPARFVAPDSPPEGEIPWVEGESLVSGNGVSLPAELVHFPPPERRIRPAITTGLGLGSSPVEALLSGLYEVIERDATMIAWYSTYEPMALEVSSEAYRTLARRALGEGLESTALLVTQDVDVPVVVAAVYCEENSAGTDEGWPSFAVGSGANLDAAGAAESALSEALQNWMELRGMGPEAAAEESGWIGEYGDFPEPAREFLDTDVRVSASNVGPEDAPTGAEELDAVVDRVAAVGLEPYAAWLTTRDLRALGFEAARVLIPEAQPLFTGESYFAERAQVVPRELGYEPRLERDPHPYP